ncbi:small secreted protein [Kitasatospora sp. NPDC054939]
MNKRLLAVPALGALLALGAVGCGGDEDNSKQLNGWAASVCSAAKDPIAQAQAALADTGQVRTGEAPADLKKRLSADIARLAKTNQQIAEAIDKAGAPKVADGEALRKDTVSELNRAAEGYLEVQKKLDGLSGDDQSKFADGLRSVADQLQALASLSTQAQAKLQRGDLGSAMAKQDGCKPSTASPAPGGGAATGGAPSGAPSADAGGASPSTGATDAAGSPAATPAPSGSADAASGTPSSPAPSAS